MAKLRKDPDNLRCLIVGRCNGKTREDQQAIADALGISLSTWYSWLCKPTDQWQVGKLKKACKILNISEEEFKQGMRY